MITRPLTALVTLSALAAALVGAAVAVADTDLPWSVAGGGGGTAGSTNYALGGTIGQPVAGSAQSTNFALGAGYWAGIADADSDGVLDDVDPEDDGDGYTDVAESGASLCVNATNEDTFDDAVVNDGCPGGPAQAGAYSEAQFKTGTGSRDPCGGNGWPSDVDSTGSSVNELDIFDITAYLGPTRRLDTSPPNPSYNTRLDLLPGRGALAQWINIQDITTLLSGTTGNPPMFNNTRAFGKVCPLAP
jgi:hypothetical protein